MMSRFRQRYHPWLTLWLTVMWVLLMGELTWGNVLGGALVGMAITMLLPLPPMPTGGIHIDGWELVKFILSWIVSLVVAAVSVSWLAIRPAEPPKGSILKAPMRLNSELELYFATAAYNLQPGGCVTDIDLANRMWTVHVLNAETEADIQKALADVDKLERSMIAIFEKRQGRHPVIKAGDSAPKRKVLRRG